MGGGGGLIKYSLMTMSADIESAEFGQAEEWMSQAYVSLDYIAVKFNALKCQVDEHRWFEENEGIEMKIT